MKPEKQHSLKSDLRLMNSSMVIGILYGPCPEIQALNKAPNQEADAELDTYL